MDVDVDVHMHMLRTYTNTISKIIAKLVYKLDVIYTVKLQKTSKPPFCWGSRALARDRVPGKARGERWPGNAGAGCGRSGASTASTVGFDSAKVFARPQGPSLEAS